jgi:hypothetical protein
MSEPSEDAVTRVSTPETIGDVRSSAFAPPRGDSISAVSPSVRLRPWEFPRWLPAALLTMLAAGAMAPLADPDLPMHLAVGRWIVQHRAVPLVEPFAWTRPGAPYFAYSWLMQTALYLLMHVAGPGALRLLHGGLLAAAFWAVLVAGRQLGWTRDTSCAVAALNLVVLTAVSPLLRPQEALFVLLPLGWALVSRALRAHGRRQLPTLLGLGLIAAITANTHVFFPLLAAPLSLALTLPRDAADDSLIGRIRWCIPAAAALVLGALCSPYSPHWVRVFELNFRANALFGQSSLIAEHQSGFSTRLGLGIALAALPLIGSGRWTQRERVVWGAMWVVGLVVFALKAKGLVVWWALAFPLAGLSASALLSSSAAYRRIPALLAFAVPIAAAFGFLRGVPPTILPLEQAWRAENAMPGTTLSSPAALATDTLLLQLAVRSHGPRVLTVFDLGSYLTWRAPGFSASIDGRTIFPDSAALPDAALPATSTDRPLGPWRSADAAVVPLNYPVAAVLDTAVGWQRVAKTDVALSPFGAVGLWLNQVQGKAPGAPGPR